MLHVYQLNLIILMHLVTERGTSSFILSKNLYIRRKQFPLILSYAVTRHTC
uniref:Uncharacterized protein n=1 Tax=Amphimedon queenslandica TaxID=400682 RepID=A0A1X7VBF3_AMPQE